MKSSIISIAIGVTFLLCNSLTMHWESGDTVQGSGTSDITSIMQENALLVDSINTPDDAHIVLKFNQSIISESVRVRVTKQSDESNVRIESFTGGEDTSSIKIILSDILEANTAYKITIISAISDEWVIIKDGADWLKEFTTPTDLARFAPAIELNAPTNPNAVIIATETMTWSVPDQVPTTTSSISETTEELPLTGIDSTIFVIIAGILWLILVIRRRQA